MKFKEKYKKELEAYKKLIADDIFLDYVILTAIGLLCDELQDKAIRTAIDETITKYTRYLLNKIV